MVCASRRMPWHSAQPKCSVSSASFTVTCDTTVSPMKRANSVETRRRTVRASNAIALARQKLSETEPFNQIIVLYNSLDLFSNHIFLVPITERLATRVDDDQGAILQRVRQRGGARDPLPGAREVSQPPSFMPIIAATIHRRRLTLSCWL